jgi:predicted transcriptional regulator
MRKTLPNLTETELAIMKALWRLRRGTVAEVRTSYADLHGRDLAYTTVLTLLGRLEAKGAVHVDKAREPYLYKPAHKEDATLRDRLRQFVETVFDGRVEDVVCQLLDSSALTDEELGRIEQTLRESQRGRGARGGRSGESAREPPREQAASRSSSSSSSGAASPPAASARERERERRQ